MTVTVKRPSYQWYPGDHRRDTALQTCSWDARALWRDLLDLMHDGTPYGHLSTNSREISVGIPTKTWAKIIGISPERARKYLRELEAAGVASRTPEGILYSRRMVRDEHIRRVRSEAGKQGGNPALLLKQEVKVPPEIRPTPAVAVASAVAFTSASARANYDRLRLEIPEPYQQDLDTLVGRAPDPGGWCGELVMLIEGGAAAPGTTWADLGSALHDYRLNGKSNTPNIRSFRSYLQSAKAERENPVPVRRSGSHAADADAAGVARANELAARIDADRARRRSEAAHAR